MADGMSWSAGLPLKGCESTGADVTLGKRIRSTHSDVTSLLIDSHLYN